MVLSALALAACSRQLAQIREHKPRRRKRLQAPEKFYAKFETTKGDFVLEVVRDWAPRGVDRFFELLQDKYYEGARFYPCASQGSLSSSESIKTPRSPSFGGS